MRLKNDVATAVVDQKLADTSSSLAAERLIEQGQEEHHRNDNYLCPSLVLVGDHLRVHSIGNDAVELDQGLDNHRIGHRHDHGLGLADTSLER